MSNKYNDEAMRRINSVLGGGHRVKPFDLTKTTDLKQAMLVAVAAYRDYFHYRSSINGLMDSYDESLEYCETATWLNLNQPENVNPLIVEGYETLGIASDVFDKLTEQAKMNCTEVIKAVLSAPAVIQKQVFKDEYKIEPQEVDVRIDELFDMLNEAEYHRSMSRNLETFLDVMKEQWK